MSRSSRIRHRPGSAAILAVALLAACARPPEPPAEPAAPAFDPVAESQVILALQREWVRRLAADDVDWIVDLHAADAWRLAPGAEPAVGHEALRVAWREIAATEGLEIARQPSVVEVAASGDLAYDLGNATITHPDGSVVPASYLVVWVREGGRWRVVADTFSPNAPAEELERNGA